MRRMKPWQVVFSNAFWPLGPSAGLTGRAGQGRLKTPSRGDELASGGVGGALGDAIGMIGIPSVYSEGPRGRGNAGFAA